MDIHEGFVLPELVIESVIRDGLLNVKATPTIIDSVFAQLGRVYNSEKYTGEIAKIKTLMNTDIPVVFNYSEVDAKPMCYSIMIGEDSEDKKRAHLGDDYGTQETAITSQVALDALVVLANIIITAYDSISGKVTCHAATDLTAVYRYMILVDAASVEFQIIGAISNETDDKFFFVAPGSVVDITDFSLIKSSNTTSISTLRGVTGDQKLVIGTHSKNALTTKYLYILLKYFILSRKDDLISRGFYVASYAGSDFNRDSDYVGDKVYTRFLTVSGKIDDVWKQELVALIDNVIITGTPIE